MSSLPPLSPFASRRREALRRSLSSSSLCTLAPRSLARLARSGKIITPPAVAMQIYWQARSLTPGSNIFPAANPPPNVSSYNIHSIVTASLRESVRNQRTMAGDLHSRRPQAPRNITLRRT